MVYWWEDGGWGGEVLSVGDGYGWWGKVGWEREGREYGPVEFMRRRF